MVSFHFVRFFTKVFGKIWHFFFFCKNLINLTNFDSFLEKVANKTTTCDCPKISVCGHWALGTGFAAIFYLKILCIHLWIVILPFLTTKNRWVYYIVYSMLREGGASFSSCFQIFIFPMRWILLLSAYLQELVIRLNCQWFQNLRNDYFVCKDGDIQFR